MCMGNKPIIFFGSLILIWLIVCLSLYDENFWKVFLMPIITGIVAGFITNWLYIYYQKLTRRQRIKNKLSIYEGKYDVYHLKDFNVPDKCNYQIVLTLDDRNAVF